MKEYCEENMSFYTTEVAYIDYSLISKEIDGIEKVLEVSKTKEQIAYFQSAINKKRSLNVVGINFIHKLLANKISGIYKQLKKQ